MTTPNLKAREPLPTRRRSWTRHVRVHDDAEGAAQSFYLSVGEYPDGRPGEIWVDAAKEGTFLRGVLSALARMASISLQCGCPVAEVVRSLRGLDFPPRGRVVGSDAVSDCTSVADWIAQEIEAAYSKPGEVLS